MTVTVIDGDCTDMLRTLSDSAANCCVTSPPYYWQRDYGVERQIGLEPDVESYVSTLVAVFRDVRRVLRPDGTLWLNLGDSYYSGNGQPCGSDPRSPSRNWMRQRLRPLDQGGWSIPKKSLLGIPWRVALALQQDGWTLRQEIVWCRQTAFPEPSVKDRPHRQHETIFLLSRARRYQFDRAALVEESVWHIAHQRGGLHSAAFPQEVAERCITAGCPIGGTVLDPFGGVGTTGLVADRLQRHAILIELNPESAAIARRRVVPDAPLFEVVDAP